MKFRKMVLVVLSFVIFPLGWGLGMWYFLRRKERELGCLFAGAGLLGLVLGVVGFLLTVLYLAFNHDPVPLG